MCKKIKNLSIIGLGLIGGSIAKALKNSKEEFLINAYDRDDVLNLAKDQKVIDNKLSKVSDALTSDLILLCLPLDKNLEVFSELAPQLNESTIISDVSGIKLPFQRQWESFESKGNYIGGHPMTGKEKGGYENSDPLLFENSVYIVTEDLSKKSDFHGFKNVIEILGANILFIPPKQHDVIAASVSHLPQLLAVTLVNTASLKTDEYNFLDLAAGGFRDLTRIASSNFAIWEDVIRQNRDQIITAIDKFSYELDTLKKWVEKTKSSEIKNYFAEARKNRDEIPQNNKGFLTPVHDVFIFVKDEPGVISKISTKLFEQGINIKDIELLKIREGNGGTFRLSFASKEFAERAKVVLTEIGFNYKED